LNRKAPMRSPAPVATWDQNHKDSRLNSWTDTYRGSHHFEGQEMSCTVHFLVGVESKMCGVVVLSVPSRLHNIDAMYLCDPGKYLPQLAALFLQLLQRSLRISHLLHQVFCSYPRRVCTSPPARRVEPNHTQHLQFLLACEHSCLGFFDELCIKGKVLNCSEDRI
jgi:hypothetical protein